MTQEQSTDRARPLRIGITGPIGCGKSTVAGWLGQRPGVVVIDADVVAREVLEPGEPALDAVVARFGSDLLRADGSLDRSALGRQVFADPAALRDLEAIVHPAVRPRILAAMDRATSAGAEAVVVEAIRLLEGGLAALCDEVWLVACDPAIQRARLVGRGSSRDDAAQRIEAQAGMIERVAPAATRIIDTSGSEAATREIVEDAIESGLRRSRDPAAG
jgi:dephospho-CoA kinase